MRKLLIDFWESLKKSVRKFCKGTNFGEQVQKPLKKF